MIEDGEGRGWLTFPLSTTSRAPNNLEKSSGCSCILRCRNTSEGSKIDTGSWWTLLVSPRGSTIDTRYSRAGGMTTFALPTDLPRKTTQIPNSPAPPPPSLPAKRRRPTEDSTLPCRGIGGIEVLCVLFTCDRMISRQVFEGYWPKWPALAIFWMSGCANPSLAAASATFMHTDIYVCPSLLKLLKHLPTPPSPSSSTSPPPHLNSS